MTIKEIFWFQILNRCPLCRDKIQPRYVNGSMPPYYCIKCEWGR